MPFFAARERDAELFQHTEFFLCLRRHRMESLVQQLSTFNSGVEHSVILLAAHVIGSFNTLVHHLLLTLPLPRH
jgi:hypothetical protein